MQALEKGLVDAVETSDELLSGLMESHEVIGVRYQQRKKMLGPHLPVARRRARSASAALVAARSETADVNNITRGLGLALLFSLVLIDQVVLVRSS
ncbi:peptidase S49 domain-containing protein [Klebsiella pneumoniae]|uniref:Peptidase S49 domain-containing protein n=1 Tax=Klebsiella pneumoniae TaxID=573 RepID=A0A2X3HK63_KLEPN|nr:peptidase S49 domain-containing protein [Klebsiella pneumoniae]